MKPVLGVVLTALTILWVPLTGEAATWFVHPDGTGAGTGWSNPLASVQAAIDSATAGDEIWVASGTYNESLTLKTGIALYGGFSATETLREERDWIGNSTILDVTGLNSRVVKVIGVEDTTLNGFTLRSGGILFRDVSSASLSHCTITGSTSGGVVCVYSSPSLTHCAITGNTASDDGGGLDCYASYPSLTHCTITGNVAGVGGGVSCALSSPTLVNCAITDNTAAAGGGLYCFGYSFPRLANCTIAGNTAGSNGGGVSCWNSSLALTNCAIADNIASTGGGVGCWSSTATLTNCTITGNTAPSGRGLACDSNQQSYPSSFKVVNSIIRNATDWLWNNDNSPLRISYSDIEGGWQDGEGNIDEEPIFVDPSGGDYRLQVGSRCIDSGSPEYANTASPETLALGDLLGRSRIWDGDSDGVSTVDMGAYEFGSPGAPPDLDENEQVDPLDLFVFQEYWRATTAPLPNSPSDDELRFNANDLIPLLRAWRNESNEAD